MAKVPDRLYIAKTDRELYDELEQEWILKGKSKKEQFMLALSFGFKSGTRRQVEQRLEFFHSKDLKSADEAILDAVALKTEGRIEVVADKDQVFTIAQEYAHAGIRLLADEVASTSFGSFEKKFEKDLFDCFRAIGSSGEKKVDTV